MNPVEKLALLRAEMAKRHIDAYVVVTDDFHTSEYVGAHFKAREFLSGFTGSAVMQGVKRGRYARRAAGRRRAVDGWPLLSAGLAAVRRQRY